MNNTPKIEKEIFENPTYKFHIRELARKTRLNPNTVITIVGRLNREGIVKRRRIKNITEVYANTDNKNFLRKKRLFNIGQLYSSGLVDFLISHFNNPEAIVSIGSYSRGEDIEKSDIDIVVITNKSSVANIEKYEKILKRGIHLLVMTYKDISKEFYQNTINGVILHGFLK